MIKFLVPYYIIQKFKEKKYNGKFKAITIFFDISGFTSMTQKLMKNGKEGAEILSNIINNVFTPSIETIYRHDGFISTFGGDSFYAIFPLGRSNQITQEALSTAKTILSMFEEHADQKTKFGNYKLGVKVGAALDKIEWGIIRNKYQNTFYFKGEAINQSAICDKYCSKGEIIINEKFKNILGNNIKCKEINRGLYKLENIEIKDKNLIKPQKYKKKNIKIQKKFYPENILKLKVKGEFRDVVSCFISFKERGKYLKNISIAIGLVNKYGGYFNRVSFGDKGGFLLVLFGAPLSKEKLLTRACEFALALKTIKGFKIKIGMTYSRAFAGFTGSNFRAEYTAQGRSVNLAARFMIKAKFGQIYIDENIKKKIGRKNKIKNAGKFKFKGFESKIQVYELIGKKDIERENIEMVGREKELKKLKKFLNHLDEGKFGGIVYIDGEAGIGKTVLMQELKGELENRYTWLYFPCDEILRNSFNPIIYFMRDYFQQSEDNEKKKNMIVFERIYKDLIDKTEDGKEELMRIKSILGSLVHLYWEGSLYEQLDGKGRYENILYGMKQLIKSESLHKPVIIELEDGHLIDSDTKKWLGVLTKNIENIPFIIISTCRFNNDGSNYSLKLNDIEERRIRLEFLNNAGVKMLTKKLLETDDIPKNTFKTILGKSEGNPFYIDQIIKYLKENRLLDKRLNIKDKTFEIPSDINSIIIARIDILTQELKEVVQTASILGREFAVKVLKKMLDNGFVDKSLIEGEKESIFHPLSELIYIFNHALIRESIYQMHLKERLRELHKLAAETIEDLYKDNLELHYTELANHYEKAELREKTVKYLKKASKYAEDNYKNDEALKCYNSLLNYTDDISEKIENYNKQLYILLNTGDIRKAKKVVQKALNLDKSIENENSMVKILCNKIHIHMHQSEFDLAKKTLDRALNINNIKNNDRAEIYRILGLYLSFTEKENDAFTYFNKALKIYKKINYKIGIANCLSDIPTFCGLRLGLDKAIEYLTESLNIFKDINNLRGVTRVMSNIAVVYDEVYMDLDKALEYYKKSIEINKEIGNIIGLMLDSNNIGSIYRLKKDYIKAIENYEQSLKLTMEIGDIVARSNTMANLSLYYRELKKYKNAETCINKALKIAKELNMKMRYYNFINEKFLLFYEMKSMNKAEKINEEILQIAKDTKNKEIENMYIINKSRINYETGNKDNAIIKLKRLYKRLNSEKQKAEIIYILWECTKEDKFRKKAVNFYEKLCSEIGKEYKNYSYKDRLDKLRNV